MYCVVALFLSVMAVSCAEVPDIGPLDKQYPEHCLFELPPDLAQRKQSLAEAANNARLEVISVERARLGAEALKLHKTLYYSLVRDQNDPFPNAVPIFLDDASQAKYVAAQYAEFHGYDGARTVYETAPGSGKYFIVDQVQGDGAGSVRLTNPVAGLPYDGSMHSWHSTKDNRLVRARIEANYKIAESVALCGCGPGWVESRDTAVAAGIKFGIFLLPGAGIPSLHPDGINAKFMDESIPVRYIPKNGTSCPLFDC